jgi:hypothetical protein
MKGLIGRHQIDQVMSNSLLFLTGGFGRPDIHISIDLHGICIDNFAPEGLCQFDGPFGFPHSRGTKEDYHLRPVPLAHFGHTE